MSNQSNADSEIINSIHTQVQTPELRSLLLQIVSDQCVTLESKTRLAAYLTGKRSRRTQPRYRAWLKHLFKR